MAIPTILGIPLWRGKIKRRVAKTYLRKLGNRWMLRPNKQAKLSSLKVGDFVNDCTGQNGRIVELHAIYRRTLSAEGRRRLVDPNLLSPGVWLTSGDAFLACGPRRVARAAQAF